jgi:glycine/D-amino acid oxidase-like deaminating enzyme
MKKADWIVIGGGVTGSILAYELLQQGVSVLLVDRNKEIRGATRLSYGGIAFWAGQTPFLRQLCQESRDRYALLREELGQDIQFRELDLLLTVNENQDPAQVEKSYQQVAIPPQRISLAEAINREPLLDPTHLSGVFWTRHGHIHPELTTKAFQNAFLSRGGEIDTVDVGRITTDPVGIQDYATSAHVVICAGAETRLLVQSLGIKIRLYFTQAELLDIPAVKDLRLQTMVSPAILLRAQLEAASSHIEQDPYWNLPHYEVVPPILDPGAIQFLDGHIRLGQISRAVTDPVVDPHMSERRIREAVSKILPAIASLPGSWHRCFVSFSADQLPVVGELPQYPGIHLFAGFSSPLAIVPAAARRFAQYMITGQPDSVLMPLDPSRPGIILGLAT